MPPLPIGKDHHPGPLLANYPHNFQSVFPGILDSPVRDVQSLPPGDVQNLCRFSRLARAIFCAPSRSHLALGQIQDSCPVSALGHLEQCAATGLFYVVAVSGQGEDVEWGRGHVSRQRIQT